ncbi:MAG: hypothetical protein RIS79_263, partial [Verrucomicrobiota bacterium]
GYGGFTGISGVAAERSVVRTYLWGQDLSGTMTGAGGVGGLISLTHQGITYHTCSDANGNITGLLAANGLDAGQLIARFDYDPFGNRITNTGPDVEICPMGFSSKYTDTETGLVDYGLRIYSPALARFLSSDPIGERGGINLYGFVGNDPVNRWDYLGLRTGGCPLPIVRPAYVPPSPNMPPYRGPGYNPNAPDHPGYPTGPSGPSTNPNRPLPQGTPSDAYPPGMNGQGGPSEEEQQRQRDNEAEKQRQRELARLPAPDHCKNGKCVEFAESELRKKGCGCCTLISYRSRMDVSRNPWGNIWSDTGVFGPASISSNGFHVGIVCGEKGPPKNLSDVLYGKTTVYDNNMPYGTTGSFWVDGAYLVPDPRTFPGSVTFLQAHYSRIGTITIGAVSP